MSTAPTEKSLNPPLWGPNKPETAGAFHELWQFNVNDLANQRSVWVGMGILLSANGFRRVADVWAVAFQRQPSKEVTKVAVRQSHDLSVFSSSPLHADGESASSTAIQIGECMLRDAQDHLVTRGSVQSKGQTVSWDLTFSPRQEIHYELVPQVLRKFRLTRDTVATVQADAIFSGTIKVNGESFTVNQAPGMQSHLSGPRAAHSWVWGHCSSFINEQGLPAAFVFEGVTARSRILGNLPSPRLSSFHFVYQGKSYAFNSLKDALQIRSASNLTEWTFQAERGDLVFRGSCRAEHKDFAGLTFEDTNGSLVFRSRTHLAEMVIHVYRRGKLETSLHSNGTAAFEIASRAKNPYVPLLF